MCGSASVRRELLTRRIFWSSWDGSCEIRVSAVDPSPTQDALDLEAWRLALASGWTPPRWWEFWRWTDDRPHSEILARLTDGDGR